MAADLIGLYQEAEKMDVDVFLFSLSADRSMAIQMGDGACAVAIDPRKMESIASVTTSLAHELGHCATGSFYSPWAACDVRGKHENRADKWAIQKLITADELDDAVAAGYTTLWALAEHFGVTLDLMRKAVCWYTHGNLAADLYY